MDRMQEWGDPCALHDAALDEWERQRPQQVDPGTTIASLVRAQHFCNVVLWGLEDEARRTDVDDSVIAGIKHSIDCWNQKRNDAVERLDEALLARLPPDPAPGAEQHSETAGQMVDRLSILALKIRHMKAYAEHTGEEKLRAECLAKLATLRTQREDLAACLARLLVECGAGRRFFKVYRQFKAYNDPRLNPALAGRQEETA